MQGPHLFLAELRRRRVLHSLVIWGIVAFAILQVYEPVMHGLHVPEWTLSFVVVALALGFPATVVLSWLFDLKVMSDTPAASNTGGTSSVPGRPGGLRLAVLLAFLGVGAATPGLAYFFVWPGHGRAALSAFVQRNTTPGSGHVIALAGFADLGTGREPDNVADALSEEVLVALTKVDRLQVVGRVFDLPFKGQPEDIGRLGHAAHADLLLSGDARREQDRLRVHAVLVSVSNGYPIWTSTHEREIRDGYLPLHEIADEIAEHVRAHFDASKGKAGAVAKTR